MRELTAIERLLILPAFSCVGAYLVWYGIQGLKRGWIRSKGIRFTGGTAQLVSLLYISSGFLFAVFCIILATIGHTLLPE